MTQWITSRTNPRVRDLAALHLRKHRQEQSLTLAEGLHLVTDALAASAPVVSLIIAQRAADLPELHDLQQHARSRGVEILHLSDDCYDKISHLQSPEGLAVTLRTETLPLETLLTPAARLLVAAGVQDPGNAGALVRTAEAAGASGCLFLGGLDLSHPRFLRGAQGGTFRFPCVAADEPDFLLALRRTSIRLLVADPHHAADYLDADYSPPLALVVGAEGLGVPPALLDAAHLRLSIPMTPPVESLNVAVAAAILLYQPRRHWR